MAWYWSNTAEYSLVSEKYHQVSSGFGSIRKRWIILGTFVCSFFIFSGCSLLFDTDTYVRSYRFHPGAAKHGNAAAASRDQRHPPDTIPNTVHFVYAAEDPAADFTFVFRHYLSMYAARLVWKPDTIYLHTNAAPSAIERARLGGAGKWARSIFELPDLVVSHVNMTTRADNGRELANMEHRSDFMRVQAVQALGGVYIDFDVVALRDVAPLRRAGFRAVAGRQAGGQLNSGTFMSAPHGGMISDWMRRMHEVYDGGWTTHSNEALTEVAMSLMRTAAPGGEVLIMEREAFAPEGWTRAQNDVVFGIHNETRSVLDDLERQESDGGEERRLELPEFDADGSQEGSEGRPGWARDWSATYMLHAFSPRRNGDHVVGFKHITPRYVLDRQSNFARVAYPAVRDMYNHGLVSIDDAFDER